MEGQWSEEKRVGGERALCCSVVGSRETVKRGLEAFLEETRAYGLIARAHIFDRAVHLRYFEIVAEIRETLCVSGKAAQALYEEASGIHGELGNKQGLV